MSVLLICTRGPERGTQEDTAPGSLESLSSEEIQPFGGAPTPLPFLLAPPLSLYLAVKSHLLPPSHWCHNIQLGSD